MNEMNLNLNYEMTLSKSMIDNATAPKTARKEILFPKNLHSTFRSIPSKEIHFFVCGAKEEALAMGHHEDDGECTNSYVAMLPRGLQQPIIESVSNLISPKSTFHLLHNEGSDQVIDQARRKLIEKAKKASNKKKKRNQINESWCQQPVGTIPLEPKFHVSLGYTKDGQSSWTCPGQVSGSVWLKIQTKDLVTSRCIGPLMSLVHVGKLSSDQNIMTSLQEVVAQIGTSIKTPTTNGNTTYRQDFDNAFRVWKQHVITQWKHQISTQDYAALKDRIEKNQLQFRLSCIREDSNVPYSRHDLLNELMQQHESILIPYRQQWTVSLKSFDMEIVLIILSNGQIAFGIALQASHHKDTSICTL